MNNFIIFFAIYFITSFLTQLPFPHANLLKKLRLWKIEMYILCFMYGFYFIFIYFFVCMDFKWC